MSTDPNYYRYYICNMQCPKLKSRELRVTKSASLPATTVTSLTASSITTDTMNVSNVTGNMSVTGNFDVMGTTHLKQTTTQSIVNSTNLENTGNIVCQGQLNVTGNTVCQGPLNVTGNTQLKQTTTQSIVNSTTLENTGNIVCQGQLNVAGTTSLQSASIANATINAMTNPLEYGSKDIHPPVGSNFQTTSLTIWDRENNGASQSGIRVKSEFVGPLYQNNAIIEGVQTGVANSPNLYFRTNNTTGMVVKTNGDVDFANNIQVAGKISAETISMDWLIPKTIGCTVRMVVQSANGSEFNPISPLLSDGYSGITCTYTNFIPSTMTGGFVPYSGTAVNDDKAKFRAPVTGYYLVSVAGRAKDASSGNVMFVGDKYYAGNTIYDAVPYSGIVPMGKDSENRIFGSHTFTILLTAGQRISLWQALVNSTNLWLWASMDIRLIG